MLYKIQRTLLQGDHVLACDDQHTVLLETVSVKLLNVAAVEYQTLISNDLAHLQIFVEQVQRVVARNLVEVFHVKYYSN